MTKYKKLEENHYTDGNGCYDSKGNCFCAECFYYGPQAVNCMCVLNEQEYNKLPTFVWDKNKQQFIINP